MHDTQTVRRIGENSTPSELCVYTGNCVSAAERERLMSDVHCHTILIINIISTWSSASAAASARRVHLSILWRVVSRLVADDWTMVERCSSPDAARAAIIALRLTLSTPWRSDVLFLLQSGPDAVITLEPCHPLTVLFDQKWWFCLQTYAPLSWRPLSCLMIMMYVWHVCWCYRPSL